MDSGLGTGWCWWAGNGAGGRFGQKGGGRSWGRGIGYLGTPGRVVRIGPRVRVKGPTSCRFGPTGQTGGLGGADVRPREGAFVPGGLLGSP